jgi:hypothetical protein
MSRHILWSRHRHTSHFSQPSSWVSQVARFRAQKFAPAMVYHPDDVRAMLGGVGALNSDDGEPGAGAVSPQAALVAVNPR